MSESFDWNQPGLDRGHFDSLANLLSLRNGGQAEPSSLSDAVLDEDWDFKHGEDEDGASLDTGFAYQISDSGHLRLKRRFLDCLAEFAANKQGGMAVACSTMKEAEDNVVIWISRNEGFSDGDKPKFDKLGGLLGSLSSNDANQSEALLWEQMVSYQQNRINDSYIPNLRASFKAYDASRIRNNRGATEIDSASDAALSVLRNLLFDHKTNGTGTLERHSRLVIASYDARQTRNVEEALNSSPNATSKSKSLWSDICLFARLRVAFQKFKDIALTLPSFEKVTVILVPRPPAPTVPPQRPLNLNQTFGILHLDLSPATATAVMGRNWTVARLQREFTKRQKQKPNIHAEVQMLVFLNSAESSASGLVPYIGCSKLSCFMCHRFIQSYGRFMTRGCHGRLFKPWTVPSTDRLLPGQAVGIAKALICVQKEVEKKLKASVEAQFGLERTSVIAGSSVLGAQQEERSHRQFQIDRLRTKAERERIAEMFRRQTQNMMSSTRHTYLTPGRDALESECEVCSRMTTRRCTFCNRGHFCSDSCGDKMSVSHLFTCSKRPLTSADYLWESMGEDLMPEDENVLEDFGFNNITFARDRTCLLGLYRGLWLSDAVSAEDLHEWRVGGVLADKIKEFYYRIPESSRGQYFPWFLKNEYVLEGRVTKEEAQQKLIATFYNGAAPYLDAGDRNKTARDLKPEAKAASYDLLAEVLYRFTPNPVELNWYSFGFVTCCGKNEESTLLDLYQLLLIESNGSSFYRFHNSRRGDFAPAPFAQFWKAYEAGTLIELMDSKGLRELRSQLPFLEAFLSVPPTGPRPSVWHLKQFLEIDDPTDYPPVLSVQVDYGFMNCHNFEELCTLMEIYRKVLTSANPMELHQACVAGNLFQFVGGHFRVKEEWRALMRNPYPLAEVVESESEPKLRSEVGAEADEDSADSSSLMSRIWTFLGGFNNYQPAK